MPDWRGPVCERGLTDLILQMEAGVLPDRQPLSSALTMIDLFKIRGACIK